LEKVQKRATKLVLTVKILCYEERLRKLKLPTLEYRRIRGDMIELYKIVAGRAGLTNVRRHRGGGGGPTHFSEQGPHIC